MEKERMIEGEGQRREYSRVGAYIPFEYRIVADEEKDPSRREFPVTPPLRN